MITKLMNGAKKSRTIRLSLLDCVIGGVVSAGPVAIQTLSSAPLLTPDSPMSVKIIFYVTIISGVYKLISGGYHAYLRFDTHGSVGE